MLRRQDNGGEFVTPREPVTGSLRAEVLLDGDPHGTGFALRVFTKTKRGSLAASGVIGQAVHEPEIEIPQTAGADAVLVVYKERMIRLMADDAVEFCGRLGQGLGRDGE